MNFLKKYKMLIVLLMLGAMFTLFFRLSVQEDKEKINFKSAVDKSHSHKVTEICSKLVSEAMNIGSYKRDYMSCISDIEDKFPESKSTATR